MLTAMVKITFQLDKRNSYLHTLNNMHSVEMIVVLYKLNMIVIRS